MKRTIIRCCRLLLLALAAEASALLPLQAQTEPAGDPLLAEKSGAKGSDAEQAGSLWEAANTAYREGNFHEAAEGYESIAALGLASPRLYYNWANACFKENRIGCAILYYRRALRLDPSLADAAYNLKVAESRTKDNIEQVPEFFLTQWLRGVRRTMNCTGWSILSLAALACGGVCCLLYLLAQRLRWRKTGFYGTIAALAIFVLATCFAAGERRSLLDRSEAVVMASSAAVKSAPDQSATDLFVLHEGTEVRLTEGAALEQWCEVTIADGRKGWIERSKIAVI